ncbi:MAG: riboflavin synthase [Elusimicrobiales bacterium]|jgi:riboflavin synthase|nr:riboflavin synthase [Elusimicrobiales bacterium]HOL62991.1 riboflavin synthase [Elusimicrobiales bacterium]HPO95067.1 riboflavin synthase [Elusimicrobiales bacterium]
MFSGIIEKTAKILDLSDKNIAIENRFEDLIIGESIAVNGVCLTLRKYDFKKTVFDISEETYSVTNFKYLKKGDIANLERALKLGDRLGGHIVSGHIDEVGKLLRVKKTAESYFFKFQVKNTEFMAEKGSVCVNGISLTCFEIIEKTFTVAVIPHTYENTNLKFLSPGSYVNIEYDILSKYLNNKKSGITREFLKENGFL